MILEEDVLGGTIDGLHRRDVPDRVETLLRWYPQQIELRVRPEAPQVEDDHHYAIDWRVLDPVRRSDYEGDPHL